MKGRSILFAGLSLGLLFLWTCGSKPASPLRNLSLRTRPEEIGRTPCGPLWEESTVVTLRGLYRTSGGEAYLDVLHFFSDGSSCWTRFFWVGGAAPGTVSWEAPLYVEVTGRLSAGRWSSPGLWDLQVERWSVLPLDGPVVREACQAAVTAHLSDLEALDWAALALPSYVTGTAGFRPDAEGLRRLELHFLGSDDSRPFLLLEGRGPALPPVRPLVERWVSLECVYDLAQGQVLELVATIRGEVHE